MKKRKKQLASRLGPVRVGVDDIERILEILSEIPGDHETSISTDEFEVGSAAELYQLRQEPVTEVSISCMLRGLAELEWVRIGIYPTWVNVSSTTDSNEIAGAVLKIEHLLKKRQLSWLARFQHWFSLSIPIVIFSLAIFSFCRRLGRYPNQECYLCDMGIVAHFLGSSWSVESFTSFTNLADGPE